jgi:para-nitrobenzyl esterase
MFMNRSPQYAHVRIGVVAAVAAFGLLFSAGLNARAAGVVVTSGGPITGLKLAAENAYLGVPYAAPPVGALRWEPPAPAAPFPGTFHAIRYAPHCAQVASPFGIASTSEDCLYLNVFTPLKEHAGDRRPVMVWIHGGAFVVGESDDYDPVRLVGNNVDVVTINYRLGALGFLAQSSLDGEGHLFANYGLLDQQAAIAWVKRNAAAFGGDANRITIFGESAGGASVLSQVASPLATGLFSRAIIESGSYVNTPTLPAAEAAGAAFATAAGCSSETSACLRSLPVSTILANEPAQYVPTVDGAILPLNPKVAVATGAFNRVPVIDGTNADEYRLFTGLDFDLMGGPITAATYPGAIAAEVGAAAAPFVLAEYPASGYPSPDVANSAALTDGAFSCDALFLDESLAKYVPTYAYEFSDVRAPELYLPPVSFPYQAAHASELQYIFNLRSAFPQALDPAQVALAATMVSYWTNFARNDKPFSQGNLFWPQYSPKFDDMIHLDTPNSPFTAFAREHKCAFWRELFSAASAGDRASRSAVHIR